jgi:biopolymer transport protein ExbD/biopolymer transport protein TolR
MGYKPKAPEVMPDINVVPMADIMLVLLIIFMVVTPMLQKGTSVELALTEHPRDMPDADKEDAVLLAVARSGNIFLGNTQITPEEITSRVREMLLNRLDKTVYVKSDARAQYGGVVRVVDEVRAAGVDQIGLLTERRTEPGQAAPIASRLPTGQD